MMPQGLSNVLTMVLTYCTVIALVDEELSVATILAIFLAIHIISNFKEGLYNEKKSDSAGTTDAQNK